MGKYLFSVEILYKPMDDEPLFDLAKLTDDKTLFARSPLCEHTGILFTQIQFIKEDLDTRKWIPLQILEFGITYIIESLETIAEHSQQKIDKFEKRKRIVNETLTKLRRK